MGSRRKLTCKTCGDRFDHHGKGRPPVYCPSHRPKGNRRRDAKRLAVTEGPEAAKAFRVATKTPGDLPEGLAQAIAPLRLAVALSFVPDVATAKGLAGIDPADTEIEEEARRLYPDLVKGAPGEIQKVLHAASAQTAISLLATANDLSGSAASQALLSIGKSLELLQASSKRVFSRVTVVMPGAESATSDPRP